MKKTIISLICFACFSITNQAQVGKEKEELSIFENPNNWKQEIIKFPIDWAPKLKLTGFEELLFTPKWSDPQSDEFWSLLIGWKVNTNAPLTLKEIEYNLYSYFDGLMKPNHWAKKFPEPKVILKNHKNSFNGIMTFFDGFHTGKVITVNIQGDQHFFKDHKKSIVSFRLSPQNYNSEVWNSLNNIKPKKEKNKGLIKLDSAWGKEIFPFPIGFAQNINYDGMAEVRFPPKGWRDPKHQNFWSYTYVWSINHTEEITAKELANNLEKYFDGLNSVDDKNKHKKATATILKINKKESTSFFKGKVKTFDRFATNKKITLSVLIESTYCKEKQKTVILFKFSPKDFTHQTWEMLKRIELVNNFCD